MLVDEMEERERLRGLMDRIRERFPDVKMEFSYQIHRPYSQLWAYVQTTARAEEVASYCKELAEETEAYDHPIWIFSKPWEGDFPGGPSIEEIRRRREEFLKSRGLVMPSSVGRGGP